MSSTLWARDFRVPNAAERSRPRAMRRREYGGTSTRSNARLGYTLASRASMGASMASCKRGSRGLARKGVYEGLSSAAKECAAMSMYAGYRAVTRNPTPGADEEVVHEVFRVMSITPRSLQSKAPRLSSRAPEGRSQRPHG